MAVFTKEWVRRNLAQFLDGDTASPIVTLGEEAIEAKEQEAELGKKIDAFRLEATEAGKKSQALNGQGQEVGGAVKGTGISQINSKLSTTSALRRTSTRCQTLKGFSAATGGAPR